MQIETLALDALIPYARNSRTHSDEQIAQVAASIREFGFTNPVLIDADGGIIAGHGRVMAARKLGLDIVPLVGRGTLHECIDRVRGGMQSTWGDFQAEGIVARPVTELCTRGGERIITKIKCRDF